jgi:hypothetical protein
MTTDPLIAAALLGTARMPALPPSPEPALDAIWQAIPRDNPASALLQGLAILRALHRSGIQPVEAGDPADPCPPETRAVLDPAAADALKRLLAGEFPEVLPEWLHLASNSARVVPGRLLPDLLNAATRNPALRSVVPALAGERGLWIARRKRTFSWVLEEIAVNDHAWDDGEPAERLAWLRQTRPADPARAAAAITSQWAGEETAMRENIIRIVAGDPQPCDEEWLESRALKDRRQEIRALAAAALVQIEGSAFRKRAHDRLRGILKLERRLLKRVIAIQPPTAFDPAWAADGIKEKAPQGTGERAWWLQQMIALVPVADWPGLLGCKPEELFSLTIDKDWQEAVVLGWLDSARRLPARSLPEHLLRFFATLSPRPPAIPPGETVLGGLFDSLPPAARFELLDEIANGLPLHLALDLLAACRMPPPPGKGNTILALLDAAIPGHFRTLTRPQARALAICIPQDGIQRRLEALAKLSELPAAAEEFATVLEFRRSLPAHFTMA